MFKQTTSVSPAEMRLQQPLNVAATALCLILSLTAYAQDTVTGAFEGTVTDSQTGASIAGAKVEFIELQRGLQGINRTDSRGTFYRGLLPPGVYRIRVSMPNYQTRERVQRLEVARTGEIIPVPVTLDPVGVVVSPATLTTTTGDDGGVRSQINTKDARRSGSFSDADATSLPTRKRERALPFVESK